MAKCYECFKTFAFRLLMMCVWLLLYYEWTLLALKLYLVSFDII